jgi:hypothetical protein
MAGPETLWAVGRSPCSVRVLPLQVRCLAPCRAGFRPGTLKRLSEPGDGSVAGQNQFGWLDLHGRRWGRGAPGAVRRTSQRGRCRAPGTHRPELQGRQVPTEGGQSRTSTLQSRRCEGHTDSDLFHVKHPGAETSGSLGDSASAQSQSGFFASIPWWRPPTERYLRTLCARFSPAPLPRAMGSR